MPIRLYSDGPIRESDPVINLFADGGPSRLCFKLPPSEMRGWGGYSLDMLGEFVPEPADSAPSWWFDGDGIGFCIEIRRAVAWHPPAPMVGVVQWDPGSRIRHSIEVTSNQWDGDDLKAAGRALKLLTATLGRKGKKLGDGARHHGDAALLAELNEAITHVQRSTGRANPDARRVMQRLSYEKSAFYAHVKRVTRKRWRDVAAEYEERGIQWN
jgi:hypothetical protein